jgi:V/A-type H+/Na+-transporting ATPase subunit E
MSFDDILRKIREDAEEEVARILAEAEEQARKTLAAAEAEAEAESRSILLAAEVEAEEEKRRILALERLEARRNLLAAKREMIDEVYAGVMERLRGLEDAAYLALVSRLILEAVETGEEKVLITPGDRGRITPEFIAGLNSELERSGKAGSLRVEEAGRDLGGGVLLRGEWTEVNCSFTELLESVKEEMEPIIVRELFPGREVGEKGSTGPEGGRTG